MRFKRLVSTALAAALTAGLLTAPASAAGLSSFRDLSDPQVAEAAEFLRLMGVVDGVGEGYFNPAGTLSRAEFCKMAVCALDRADEETAQQGRTIYLDVGSDHWARGYINLASVITLGSSSDGKGGTALVAGVGDGTFQPNRPITYGEAVTILCRVLGYGVDDVSRGGAWYDGYLSAAQSIGLTDGLGLSGTDVITRAQAAILFYNLYFTDPKGSKDSYLVSLGGKEQEGCVILDADATADDGTDAVETTKGTFKSERVFDPTLEGQEGKLLLDEDDKLLAFQPKEGTSRRVVNISSAQATYLIASGGEKLTVEPDTVVYRDGKATTWQAVSTDIKSSSSVAFHYGANGKLSYLFFPTDPDHGPTAMVARTNPNGATNPFASMASGGSYTMFKNGAAATAADIRQYDVATFDAGTQVIQVSDLKLTGIYEDASPSPAAPVTITVMGHDFPVLSSARRDLSSFKVGDKLTLLLTVDGAVAGAVSANTVKSQAVGLASVSNDTATVTLIQGGITVSGKVSYGAKDRCHNQLVTVTSSAVGRLSLEKVSGTEVRSALDVSARRLGDREVADNVAVYDRVPDGAMVQVSYDDLSSPVIGREKIAFVSYDYAGRVKCIVLNDATGDAYTYGYFSYVSAERDEDGKPIGSAQLCVRQAGSDGTETRSAQGEFSGSVRHDAPGGLAYTSDGKVAAAAYLQTLNKVSRTDFDSDEMTVTVAGVSYPVSDQVQCYNTTTKTWFAPGKVGMEAARAYADHLTLYYDRSPAEGGKIRLIVVE